MSDCFGIDFGTTNSVLARATANNVEVISLDDQLPGEWANIGFDRVLPSVIGFEGSTPTFGWLAKRQMEDKLEAVKRLFKDQDTVRIGTEEMHVEEAAAMFFRHIKDRAAVAGVAGRLDRAVVTIPANSRGVARYRTKLAAGLAGIEVAALINEPTAAAMAHSRALAHNQRILVFDWGGGTLDVTVLLSSDGVFIEESSKGIQRLGGIDVDQAFMQVVLRTVPGSADWLQHELNLFRLNLELAKVQLSILRTTQVATPRNSYVEVTRGQLEEAIWPLIQRTREPVETCLRDSPGRIDHLIMVGGSSKMPIIQRFIADMIGADVSTEVDPMTAIAEGAAIACGILSGVVQDVDFFVGTEHALGTITHNESSPKLGEFAVLIPRNHKYPASAKKPFSPVNDMQEKVLIQVIEGDPTKPIDDEDNVIIKNWEVALEPRLADDAGFDVTFEYDVDGILRVLVEDQRTGQVMMDDELAFGASENRSALPHMRKRVDSLMNPDAPRSAIPPQRAAAEGLSSESQITLRKARTKVLPFIEGPDLATLRGLVRALESATPAEEEACRESVERELRNHAYLL
jgi:molecular chaperone DnaK (HSP70)